jgi:hypothetical protein
MRIFQYLNMPLGHSFGTSTISSSTTLRKNCTPSQLFSKKNVHSNRYHVLGLQHLRRHRSHVRGAIFPGRPGAYSS